MADHDAVIVGSGINSLACAALLARAGWDVCVLERSAQLGGAIQTAELTEPGFQHDVFSAWHPLWVGGAAHAELGDELAARGLEEGIGRILRSLFEQRNDVDYGEADASREDAELAIRDAQHFVDAVESWLPG